jgi:hypothetical protein
MGASFDVNKSLADGFFSAPCTPLAQVSPASVTERLRSPAPVLVVDLAPLFLVAVLADRGVDGACGRGRPAQHGSAIIAGIAVRFALEVG